MFNQAGIPMRQMNGSERVRRTRSQMTGWSQGELPAKEVEYDFISTNWVRDTADTRKEQIFLTHLNKGDSNQVDQVATRWM